MRTPSRRLLLLRPLLALVAEGARRLSPLHSHPGLPLGRPLLLLLLEMAVEGMAEGITETTAPWVMLTWVQERAARARASMTTPG